MLQAQCQESGALWEDPDFPATDSSLFFENPPSQYPDIEWLRPGVSSSEQKLSSNCSHDGWDRRIHFQGCGYGNLTNTIQIPLSVKMF